jgi:hypothetical protein
VEPAATAELILEEPPPAAEEAPAAPPALHWAAEPAEVTEADRALFGPPAAMAGAALAPESAPDWGDLLKHVEEPMEATAAATPAPAAEPPVEAPAAAVAEAAAAIPAEPAPEAIPAQEPVPAEAAAPPQARVALDPEMVRAAVEGGFDKAGMTALKAVPGLVDAIISEILRRMN